MACKFLVALIIGSALGSSAEAADMIRIAVSNPNMPNLTVAVAQKKGFFKDETIESELSA